MFSITSRRLGVAILSGLVIAAPAAAETTEGGAPAPMSDPGQSGARPVSTLQTAPIGGIRSNTPVQTPQRVPVADIPGMTDGPGAEAASPLATIAGATMPDEGPKLFWTLARSGTLFVKNGDTFTLSYLSRGKPSYNRVALVFEERGDQLNAPDTCAALASSPSRITMVEAQIAAQPADPNLVTTSKTSDVRLIGTMTDVYLVRATAAYNGDLLVAAQMKKTASVRALPLGPDHQCLRSSAGAYLATLVVPSSNPVNPFPKPPKQNPSVGVSVRPVGWSPSINRNCSYIITADVSDPAWREVLKARGISRSVGTHLTLCQEDFTSTFTHLPDDVRAKIVIEKALGAFTHAFNWTADKFKSVGSALGSPLKPILGQAAATAFGEALMGQLPGSPLTGHLSVTIDRGCGYVKDKVAAVFADKEGTKDLPADQRKLSDDTVQKACDAVQAAMAENAKASDFLQIDLSKEPRGPLMWIKISYDGQNGAPAGMLSQPFTTTLTVRSKGGAGAIEKGTSPAILLYRRDFAIPAGPANTSLIVPVAMETAIPETSQGFQIGATASDGMELNAGGYPGFDIVIHSTQQYVPPPAS